MVALWFEWFEWLGVFALEHEQGEASFLVTVFFSRCLGVPFFALSLRPVTR